MNVIAMSPETLASRERRALEHAAVRFPRHVFRALGNDDGQRWCVLEPRPGSGEAIRFTICRLAGSIMILAEHETGGRQMYRSPDLDGALALMRALDQGAATG